MKSNLQRVLQLNKFFKIQNVKEQSVQYSLKQPSILLMNNIYLKWINSTFIKTQKNITMFTNKKFFKESNTKDTPVGYIDNDLQGYMESSVVEQSIENYTPEKFSKLCINLFVPQSNSMQYFIQWQRYRKYWWSSISSTPSLFAVNEIKYDNDVAYANIIAKFPWGSYPIETVKITPTKEDHTVHLSCSMSLECALMILLTDGLINSTKEGYLRLHRTMAPYKFSFVLEEDKNKDILIDLAKLIHHKQKQNNIPSVLPNFTLSANHQIKENLQLGVPYTAVLSENTLVNGIFHLLSSSTMLKEQVHLADFNTYANQISKT